MRAAMKDMVERCGFRGVERERGVEGGVEGNPTPEN